MKRSTSCAPSVFKPGDLVEVMVAAWPWSPTKKFLSILGRCELGDVCFVVATDDMPRGDGSVNRTCLIMMSSGRLGWYNAAFLKVCDATAT